MLSKSLGEELVNDGHVVVQRRRGQPTFLQQVAPESMGHALPRTLYRRFCPCCATTPVLAKQGQESAQCAGIATADSAVPFAMSVRNRSTTLLSRSWSRDVFLLKPSTEIGDHHDLVSDRVSRIALLGYSGSVSVKVFISKAPGAAVQSCLEE